MVIAFVGIAIWLALRPKARIVISCFYLKTDEKNCSVWYIDVRNIGKSMAKNLDFNWMELKTAQRIQAGKVLPLRRSSRKTKIFARLVSSPACN